MLAAPGVPEAILARRLPAGVRALNAPAFEDLPLRPGGRHIPGATDACPAWRDVARPALLPFGLPPQRAQGGDDTS